MTEYEASKVLDDYIKLPEVFKFYGYEVNRSGFCCCPFHLEDSPSCKVNDYQFHCFGCDARGNAISFMKGLFNLGFKEAIQKINYDFGLGLLTQNLTPAQNERIKKRQVEIYERKQQEIDFEETKQRYLDAWKNYIIFKPDNPQYDGKHYDINTPEYLVKEWEDSVDPRWWEAVNTLNELQLTAYLNNYTIDEDEARWAFTK